MSTALKRRTQLFAIACGKPCAKFPRGRTFNAYCDQLIRSSASVGANYRAAIRGKSDRDFLNKLKIVEEEADESIYWLEILEAMSEKEYVQLKPLKKEANELTAIFVASIKTTRARMKRNGK
ncbi:MAG: four helix bundle protein [Leeuwenhoekiella sp.]